MPSVPSEEKVNVCVLFPLSVTLNGEAYASSGPVGFNRFATPTPVPATACTPTLKFKLSGGCALADSVRATCT